MIVKMANDIIGENKEKELLEALKARNLYLKKLIAEKEKAIAKAPEGLLRISSRGNRIQYYYRTDPKDFNGEYINEDNRQLAFKLAQKDYDSRVLKLAEAEIKLAEKYEKLLENNMISDVYESLHEGRRRLIIPTELSSEQFAEGWMNVNYEPMSVSNDISFYSTCGVRVRSKSELIIANMLEQKGIPYRYEYPITLRGQGTVRPDFMCLNVRTRQEYIWEHFGMMDNIAYANKNVAKINVYEQNGYFQGKNMIMTFETSQHALSSNIIKAMIEQYLI